MSNPHFNGIIPPMITPLEDRDTLDMDGLEKLTEHMIAGGIHGLFVLGTTGEGPSLSYRLREQLIRSACQIVDGRIPVLISVTDTAFVESVRLSHVAAEAGAAAVVIATPYYFPAEQKELEQYVKQLVSELALPVMLYNMPSLTKVWFEIETLKTLAGDERILGVKDSSGDLSFYRQLCALKSERPDWSLFMGPEDKLIESVRMGGNGGVNGGANIYPRLFVDAYEASMAGDEFRCDEIQKTITTLGRIYEVRQHASRHIKATKCAASILGLCQEVMAWPITPFGPEERKKISQILETLNLLST